MEEYLSFAKSLAKEAGKIMTSYFQMGVKSQLKKDFSIVTQADTEINDLVIKKVSEQFPNHSVLGEEANNEKESELVWICDPVDGTTPFSKGVPTSVFSLALVKNGDPQVGVIYDPFMDRLFSAVKGQGAYLNGQLIKVSDKKIDHTALVNIEWWTEAEYDIKKSLHQLEIDSRAYFLQIGCVAYACCMVAAGQYEACVFAGSKTKFVDVAAAKLVVEEAGGKVTDLFGNNQRYDRDIKGAILSNGKDHEKILKYLQDL